MVIFIHLLVPRSGMVSPVCEIGDCLSQAQAALTAWAALAARKMSAKFQYKKHWFFVHFTWH
ncbi:MAG: hypothetical protein HF973_00885 [Chloroflexi bacterium]|nr:hypothetical protein [Chloroflexota bacterium]